MYLLHRLFVEALSGDVSRRYSHRSSSNHCPVRGKRSVRPAKDAWSVVDRKLKACIVQLWQMSLVIDSRSVLCLARLVFFLFVYQSARHSAVI